MDKARLKARSRPRLVVAHHMHVGPRPNVLAAMEAAAAMQGAESAARALSLLRRASAWCLDACESRAGILVDCGGGSSSSSGCSSSDAAAIHSLLQEAASVTLQQFREVCDAFESKSYLESATLTLLSPCRRRPPGGDEPPAWAHSLCGLDWRSSAALLMVTAMAEAEALVRCCFRRTLACAAPRAHQQHPAPSVDQLYHRRACVVADDA